MTDLSHALTLRYATHYLFLLAGVALGATIVIASQWFQGRRNREENPFHDTRRSRQGGPDGRGETR